MLNIQDFTGSLSVESAEELTAFLNRRDAEGYNCFNMNHGEKEFPYLVIMVHDLLATVTFVINRDGRSLQSQCRDMKAAGRGIHRFLGSALGPITSMARTSVIPFADAVMIAQEYMETHRCPTRIEWIDLG